MCISLSFLDGSRFYLNNIHIIIVKKLEYTCKDKVIIVVQILGILVHTNTQKKKCIVVYIKSYLCILEQQKLLLRLTPKIRCWKLIHVYKSRVCGLPCWKDLRFPPNVFFFFFKLHGGSKIHRQQVYVPVFFIYHQLAQ